MEHLFYLSGIVFIIYETITFTYPNIALSIRKDVIGTAKLNKEFKKAKIDQRVELTKYEGFYLLFNLYYLVWNLIGFFTQFWYLFLGLSIISICVPKAKNVKLIKLDAILTLITLQAILILKYLI